MTSDERTYPTGLIINQYTVHLLRRHLRTRKAVCKLFASAIFALSHHHRCKSDMSEPTNRRQAHLCSRPLDRDLRPLLPPPRFERARLSRVHRFGYEIICLHVPHQFHVVVIATM